MNDTIKNIDEKGKKDLMQNYIDYMTQKDKWVKDIKLALLAEVAEKIKLLMTNCRQHEYCEGTDNGVNHALSVIAKMIKENKNG